jgi:mRNA-degrading endonuclease RelE of RelBE toxin-antitoxin system
LPKNTQKTLKVHIEFIKKPQKTPKKQPKNSEKNDKKTPKKRRGNYIICYKKHLKKQ